VLTNGGDFNGLRRDLVDPWIHGAANVHLTAEGPALEPTGPAASPERYVGVYGGRNQRITVAASDDGTLEQSASLTGEFAATFERAGLEAGPWTARLHQVSGDLFATADANGAASGYVQFLDTDYAGRAGFLHTGGRSMPRIGQ
jgi:hypothetical protein